MGDEHSDAVDSNPWLDMVLPMVVTGFIVYSLLQIGLMLYGPDTVGGTKPHVNQWTTISAFAS